MLCDIQRTEVYSHQHVSKKIYSKWGKELRGLDTTGISAATFYKRHSFFWLPVCPSANQSPFSKVVYRIRNKLLRSVAHSCIFNKTFLPKERRKHFDRIALSFESESISRKCLTTKDKWCILVTIGMFILWTATCENLPWNMCDKRNSVCAIAQSD